MLSRVDMYMMLRVLPLSMSTLWTRLVLNSGATTRG
jgi:hypothetical protein